MITLCQILLILLLSFVSSKMESKNLTYKRQDQHIIITPKGKPHTETLIFLHGLGDTADGWFDLFYSKLSPVKDVSFLFPSSIA